ncbi:MAG: helix-turn-helix domain-containing protein [Bacteroidetes bacterium]|nr:helix-turn-helix domain-containing protein [Bacteroidota bacterium]
MPRTILGHNKYQASRILTNIEKNNMKKESHVTFITTRQVAEKLCISRKQVIRWIRGAGLPSYQIGRDFRFIESEIDEWIEHHKYRTEFDSRLLDDHFQPIERKKRG